MTDSIRIYTKPKDNDTYYYVVGSWSPYSTECATTLWGAKRRGKKMLKRYLRSAEPFNATYTLDDL